MRRLGAWILRRLGLVCTLGSRGFPDEHFAYKPTQEERDDLLLSITLKGGCTVVDPGEEANDRPKEAVHTGEHHG